MKNGLAKKVIISLLAISTAIAVLAYKANPRLFMPRKPGSFEYIREGETALNKGEHTRAIGFFEKALKSSPDDRTIQDHTIWAYTEYGTVLEEREDYDGAISYLEKACVIRQDGAIIKNLAAIHARKALQLAKKGEWSAAIKEFERARAVAGESAYAAKRLAVMLFNDAVEEYKSGRDITAMLCLKESCLTDENYQSRDLLAGIFYKKGDLENAAFCWARAKELAPENEMVAERLGNVLREMEVARTAKIIPSPHFELAYKTSQPSDTSLTKEILEKAYSRIGEDLGYFQNPKTVIFFYSEDDFRNIFKVSPMVRAFYDGNIRMPLPDGGLAKEEFARYINHEYTHAAVSAMTNNNCPVWLNEGIAVREESLKDGPRLKITGEIRDVSLEDLEAAFAHGNKDTDIRPYYFSAYTVVEFVVDNWGISALRNILKRLSDGEHFVNAMDDELLLSKKDFEDRWHAYVHKKYSK